MKIASVQIPNTSNVEINFQHILTNINKSIEQNCDLILFPECALSGFTAEMKKCSLDYLAHYLNKLKKLSSENKLTIVLPSAYVENSKIFNAVFIFKDNVIETLYKVGLTDSEKSFFSIPDNYKNKVFLSHGYKIALLLCYEAQLNPYEFFKESEVDLILWPGYINSGVEKIWDVSTADKVYLNMKSWKVPLIQANFSFNDSSINSDTGPDGHSVFLNSSNELVLRAKYKDVDFNTIILEDLI
jgi:predicted amidohydrolase